METSRAKHLLISGWTGSRNKKAGVDTVKVAEGTYYPSDTVSFTETVMVYLLIRYSQ